MPPTEESYPSSRKHRECARPLKMVDLISLHLLCGGRTDSRIDSFCPDRYGLDRHRPRTEFRPKLWQEQSQLRLFSHDLDDLQSYREQSAQFARLEVKSVSAPGALFIGSLIAQRLRLHRIIVIHSDLRVGNVSSIPCEVIFEPVLTWHEVSAPFCVGLPGSRMCLH